MADFSDVAVNADMIKIANAIRRVTRTAAKMTIPEMPERLIDIRVLEQMELEVSFAEGNKILLGQFETQYPHLFMVLPIANEDAVKLGRVDPEIELEYEEGNLYLAFGRNQDIVANLVLIDFLLPSDEPSRGMLIHSSNASGVEDYDATKPYRRGEGFIYEGSYGLTLVDHEPESFNADHCEILANQVFDADGNTYHDLSYYSAMLIQEIADRADAEAAIDAKIDDAVNDLEDAIQDEITARESAVQDLQAALDAEALAREEADGALERKLEIEEANRIAQDDALQASIDGEADARAQVDDALQQAIDTEAYDRAAADTTLQGNIDSEASTRENDDQVLQQNIDAEVATREQEVQGLTNDLADETEARENADTQLGLDISAEETRAKGIEEGLRTDLSAETSARQSAVSQLESGLAAETSSRRADVEDLYALAEDEAERAAQAEEALEANKLDNSGSKTFDGDLTITGDLVVNGVQHIAESETLLVEEKVIEVARKNTEPFASMAGILANNYDGENSGGIFFDNEGTAFVGDLDNSKLYQAVEFTPAKPYAPNVYYYKDDGKYILDDSPTQVEGRDYYEKDYSGITKNNNPELVPLAARERVENWTDEHMPMWDADNKVFKDSGVKVGAGEITVAGSLEIKTSGSAKELKLDGWDSITADGDKVLTKDLDDFTEQEFQAIVAEEVA